jgi:hypothetical protein
MKNRSVVLAVVFAVSSVVWSEESALDRGRRLFRENRWEEAREAVRGELERLAPGEREQARLLIGLSHVKEAELYGSLSVFATEVGLAYLRELAQSEENRDNKWLPLFTGIYQLSAGDDREAEKSLAAVLSARLPHEWLRKARVRLAVARSTPPVESDASPEARYYAALLSGSRPDREVLEALVSVNLDAPDVEDTTDPEKLLRFFDPIRLAALERRAWERATEELSPLAAEGNGMAHKLARLYAGVCLFTLGETTEAAELLARIDVRALGPVFHRRARLLAAAAAWRERPPTVAELDELWQTTQAYADAVLLWKEVERPELSNVEPFVSKLPERLASLPHVWGEHPDQTTIGRWGLTALLSGVDSSEVLGTLSRYRNHANKNKIEFNDPLLLVALSRANYEKNDYAQALETLFELSKTFPGLRGLQWNLQGVYAARQKAGGDARIAN